MKRQLAENIPGAGLRGFIMAAVLLSLIRPGSTAEAQDVQYQLIVQAMPTKTCIQPPKYIQIQAFVVRTDRNKTRRVPDIGIVAGSPQLGQLNRPSDITARPLMYARFTYLPISEGTDTIEFNAIGKDPTNGKVIQLTTTVVVRNVRCSLSIDINGFTQLTKDALYESAYGIGTAEFRDDLTLSGQGLLHMSQQWGLPASICKNQRVEGWFAFNITGTWSPQSPMVHLQLKFEGDPIPAQSQLVECDTGGGSSIKFKIPVWPLTPLYLPINEFDANEYGDAIVLQYPMRGEQDELIISVMVAPGK